MGQFTDLSFLKTFTGGDAAKIKKYVTMFTGSAQKMLDKIQSDCGESNWSALKTSSHTIKTQLKYMGAEKAHSIAFEIEQLSAKADDTAPISGLVDELNKICEGVIIELNDELNKL